MDRMVLGVVLGLILGGVGIYWWQASAQVEEKAPPPPPELEERVDHDQLPLADPADLTGPAPPEASELTKEEKRFFRYDRNRDRIISRNEMLSSRTKAFRKLDVDGNNLLTFEEWAVTTVRRFDAADADKNKELTPAEFASTRPKRNPNRQSGRANCRC